MTRGLQSLRVFHGTIGESVPISFTSMLSEHKIQFYFTHKIDYENSFYEITESNTGLSTVRFNW